MHCHTASGQWAAQLLQCTASPPWGRGQWNSCQTLPHCLGAMGSRTPAMHHLTAWRQWAVEFLQSTPRCLKAVGSTTPVMHCHTAWGVPLLQCIAPLPWGTWRGNSCNARAHQLGGPGVRPRRRSLPKERNSCNALPHCLGALGSGTPTMHCHTAWGQWGAQLLHCTASVPAAVGIGTSTMHCHTSWGQWAMELLQCTASPPGVNGQWNSCTTLPHYLGATGSAILALHCPIGQGQWAVQLLQCPHTLPRGSRPLNRAMHFCTAVGQ